MKRQKFLWPLTQGHHRGLVAAKNIKNRAMRVQEASEPLAPLAEEARAFWDSELKPHFQAEEELLKVFAVHVGNQDEGVTRILAEHRSMEKWIQSGAAEDLAQFAKTLTIHIRYEEEVLFGRIEEALTEMEIEKEEKLLKKAAPACVAIPRRSVGN